jgi:hypothetical protein
MWMATEAWNNVFLELLTIIEQSEINYW